MDLMKRHVAQVLGQGRQGRLRELQVDAGSPHLGRQHNIIRSRNQ